MKKESVNRDSYITKITHVKGDVVNVIPKLEGKVAVLNFFSARNPGGGFLKGSNAQEEALARSSDLYCYLKNHNEFYQNPKHQKSGLYDSDIIYYLFIIK